MELCNISLGYKDSHQRIPALSGALRRVETLLALSQAAPFFRFPGSENGFSRRNT